MAQKAAKQLARRNTEILRRTHLIMISVHSVFIALRFLLRRSSFSSMMIYVLLSSPSLIIELWLERVGRPTYVDGTGDVRRSGEDLEAKGLTEYLWDVLYWSWGCIALAGLFGDWAWWLWAVIPLYSAWLAYTTLGGMKQGLGGLGAEAVGSDGASSTSNRQKKMERRGGQRVQHR